MLQTAAPEVSEYLPGMHGRQFAPAVPAAHRRCAGMAIGGDGIMPAGMSQLTPAKPAWHMHA